MCLLYSRIVESMKVIIIHKNKHRLYRYVNPQFSSNLVDVRFGWPSPGWACTGLYKETRENHNNPITTKFI